LKIDLLVTGRADGLVEDCIAIDMASITSKSGAIRLPLVGSKGITKDFMCNVNLGHIGQRGIHTPVIRVTGTTWHAGFFLQLISMQGGWVLQLGSDICMT
jgi:hypothetical protein